VKRDPAEEQAQTVATEGVLRQFEGEYFYEDLGAFLNAFLT
jgi:hypothetical protein